MTNENDHLASPRTSPKTTLQWIEQGRTDYRAKHYAEAIRAFDQALHLDPRCVLAYHLKALTLFGLNRITEGRGLIEQARKIQAEEVSAASGWQLLDIPGGFFERLSGFSLPADHQVVLISSEGLHSIDLNSPQEVQTDESYPEGGDLSDWEHQVLYYNGKRFQILGVHGGHPLLESTYGEKLLFDLKSKILTIEDKDGNVQLKYQCEDLSWHWGYATFSRDANFVVLGLPYFFAIFQRVV